MKTLLTIFFSLVIISSGIAQTVRRVNNNIGISGTNVYSTAQAAHDAAVANDIIIIDPSTTSYGSLTLSKPLKIYGNGYFLTINTELKADQRNSTLGVIEFNTGSGGSEMYGITASNVYIFGVSNITLSRNNVTGDVSIYNQNKVATTYTNVSNVFISRNYLSFLRAGTASGYTSSNVLVNNNILGYICCMADPRDQNWVIRNNTFTTSAANTATIVNSVFENNLMYAGGAFTSFINVTYSYNVSKTATFSGGTANVNNYDWVTNSEFSGAGTGISDDETYQIKAGSALKTLGSSSSEVGAYGGSTPYIVSGIPAIPSITSMVNTGTGDATTPIKVTISVKSNN